MFILHNIWVWLVEVSGAAPGVITCRHRPALPRAPNMIYNPALQLAGSAWTRPGGGGRWLSWLQPGARMNSVSVCRTVCKAEIPHSPQRLNGIPSPMIVTVILDLFEYLKGFLVSCIRFRSLNLYCVISLSWNTLSWQWAGYKGCFHRE